MKCIVSLLERPEGWAHVRQQGHDPSEAAREELPAPCLSPAPMASCVPQLADGSHQSSVFTLHSPCLHSPFPLWVSVCVQIPFFYKDTGRIRFQPNANDLNRT